MNYTEIKTSKKMNEVVKEQLIFRDDHLSKYAAKRIEELEQLILSGVSHQRELLCEYTRQLKKQGTLTKGQSEIKLVDKFMSHNCG
tara:strand:- start:53 stop:310 length:258 start_codon:yes stop_codon:yes gene_type:complete